MALNQVSAVPAGVLRVSSYVILIYTCTFSNQEPYLIRKHMPCGIGTESLGMIGCIFAENGPLEGGIQSSFSGTAGVLRVISDGFRAPTRAFSAEALHHFPKVYALRYGHRKFGNDWMYVRGEWALRMWHWIKFQWYRLGCKGWFQMDFGPQTVRFRRGHPPIFESKCPAV